MAAHMGAFGAGYPISFRCSKCKVLRRARGTKGMNVVRTGKLAPLTNAQNGRGHPRALQYRVQYKCLDCGHCGWTRHVDVEIYPVKDQNE